MRKFDLSLRSSRSSYFATFRHQLTILSKTDALDEEKWLNMLGTFVRSEERFSRNAETELVCRLLLEKKNRCTCLKSCAVTTSVISNTSPVWPIDRRGSAGSTASHNRVPSNGEISEASFH